MFDVSNVFTYAYSDGTIADFFQTITADAASTNYIDLKVGDLNIAGGSKKAYIVAYVGTVDFGQIASLEIRLETDSNTNFSTTKKDILLGRFALSDLTAGALLLNVPFPVVKYQRYMRIYFNVFTSANAGKIMVAITDGPESAVAQVDHVEAAS